MKSKWKVLIGVLVVAVLGIGVYASTVYSKKGVVTVQTGSVVRQDLTSLVTASGEIKPKNYINIGANAQGEIRELLVKEGDRVRKGQLLARIENVQPEADVEAQKATLNSAEADSSASEAAVKAADENIRTMQAMIDKDKSDLDRAKAEYDRSQALYNEHLLAKQDFDLRRYTYEAQQATVKQSEMRLIQARAQREQTVAQLASSQKRIAQYQAGLVRFNDILQKHNAYAPLDGVVTNLPVRVGETVVHGRPELGRQHHHDDRRHVADHRGSQGGRDRYRECEAGSDGRHHDRRDSEQDVQGPRDRNRQHRDPALHGRGGDPERDFQPGSQGFQGGDRAGQSAGRNSPRTFLHGKDNHSHPEKRPEYTDPGAHGPAEGASGAETGQWKGCASRSHQAGSGGGEGEEGRNSGRFCGFGREGGFQEGGDRDYRRHRYRGGQRSDGRRSDRDRHLSGDSHHSERGTGKGG